MPDPYTGTLTEIRDAALNDLVMQLRTGTPLGRVGHDEAHAVFERLTELGYRIYKPDPA
jgi:hypothetical protein